jgi:L-lactate dehydrogenase complex protein LldF
MEPSSRAFTENARAALEDAGLQRALAMMKAGFVVNRAAAVERLPEFDALCDEARAIKDHTLDHLDYYLEQFEARVTEAGGKVHWCRTPEEARRTILGICRSVDAKTVTKGKSMIGEEIAINDFLEENGIAPIETDLGEYIIQLRREPPSHIIAPAIHVTKKEVADSFYATHDALDPGRTLDEPRDLVDEARAMLRQKYLDADLGITGANFLIAETGTSVIVTNEGNGDLTQTLPKAHVVIASLEKVVPTLEDATTILRVLARSATGQEFSTYTTFSTGPRRADDPDGPGEYHVVLLDNGRSSLLGTELQPILRCIRCGACMNHCPVYGAIGGHAYGWVYPGPMGAVLTPALIGIDEAAALPEASTFCGRCEDVCPMRIPLPSLMRHHRETSFTAGRTGWRARAALRIWAALARRPWLYRIVTGVEMRLLAAFAGRRGRFRWLPFAGGWTRHRDFPAPEGKTFQRLWSERDGNR